MDYEMNAEPRKFNIKGSSLSAVVTRGAESWQFFAFVFAAALTFVLSVIDSIVAVVGSTQAPAYGLAAKIVSGIGLAYLFLVNVRVRNRLVGLLGQWKKEKHF